MTKAFIAFLLIFSSSTLYGQFGIGAKYQSVVSSNFSDLLENIGVNYNDRVVGGSLFYWFRLKNRRMEFLPEISYVTTFSSSDEIFVTQLQKILISFNTDIYLFDFEGDCNCPTFSKQGGYFQKSFFVEITPGMDIQFFEMEPIVGVDFSGSALAFRIGLGVGFDFGVSDMVTITPTVGMNWSSSPSWYDHIGAIGGEWIFSAGIRALFRPDY
ncbi:MAG: hypothetical protein DRI69_08080 [Bacteroidetes bacterium]|nr:MAG: hypothetical protein DRI69_08080 [Bacteroidota bacterium]